MTRDQKIQALRHLMKQSNIAAIIVSGQDPHGSEYVAEHWQTRKWLTGFSGSAGTAVVTLNQAVLWTDSRYYIQAQEQILESGFVLFKTGQPDVPDVQNWLEDNLMQNDIVGLDGSVFSLAGIKKLESGLNARGIVLNTDIDFICQLWMDRPQIPASKAFLFSDRYAGQSRKNKLAHIRKQMAKLNASHHLMATLDDIAWTLNLRGSDVHTNPVNICFLLIGTRKAVLFMDDRKLDDAIRTALVQDHIEIHDYGQIFSALSLLSDKDGILIDPENINYRLYQAICHKDKIIEKPNPAIALKAVKNDVQIAHLKDTAVKDGIAVVNFLFWLEQQKDTDKICEQSAADVLYALRKEQDLFMGNSFDPIMAWREHSAIVHYTATDRTNADIGSDGMFLTDTGGNYLSGTTDITRTVYRGAAPDQVIRDYTRVLKGHIALATAVFPKGTKGYQIDTLARQFLWHQGLDYGHGTGHGVGFFLCVHEGPARISSYPTDVKLEKGMLLTNEPGLYRDGEYGIRLENMILVCLACEKEFGEFLKFETMTWCHFERHLMDKTMLSTGEINYINTYHSRVYEALSAHLKPDVAAWLKEKTRPL